MLDRIVKGQGRQGLTDLLAERENCTDSPLWRHPVSSRPMLDRVRIILVETSLSGNIGSAARAMKTMGLSQLVLVNPRQFPSAEATARASGADDLLARARVCSSLPEAIDGCQWVIGTSARIRSMEWPLHDPREAARQLAAEAVDGDVAVVFGRERSGLSNEELDHCQALLQVPANPEYSSLNLAMAVQLIAYELRMVMLGEQTLVRPEFGTAASADKVEGFYGHLEQTLVDIGSLDPDDPRYLMRRLRRLFSRTRLTEDELNILRGILSQVGKRCR